MPNLLYFNFDHYFIGKKKSAESDLLFCLWLKFRPTENFKSFVFYCYYCRVTKISTDYFLCRLFFTDKVTNNLCVHLFLRIIFYWKTLKNPMKHRKITSENNINQENVEKSTLKFSWNKFSKIFSKIPYSRLPNRQGYQIGGSKLNK